MSSNYLKEEQYYADLYDLSTIEKCLWSLEYWRKQYREAKKDKNKSGKDKLKAINYCYNMDLYFTKGERYKNRGERIKECLEADKKRQDFYDNTLPPSEIHCPTCGNKLHSDFKLIWDFTDQPQRMLFYFPCKKCHKKVAYYNTGEVHTSKPNLCPKCSHEITSHIKETKDGAIWTKRCTSCKFTEVEVDDFKQHKTEQAMKEAEDRKLLEKYRSEFCLSEEEGKKYLEGIANMNALSELVDKYKERDEHKDVYDKVAALKKLTIVELEKLLSTVLQVEQYIKLEISSPQLGQFVSVNFTVRDAKLGRNEYDSKNNLRKLINRTLLDTTWRLMSEGTSYRLGFLQGRLRAYEKEEDLVKLVGGGKQTPVMETDEGFIY